MTRLFSSSALVALGAGATIAAACSGAAFGQPTDAAEIGEVVVTAQKRAENVQDVPLAVQVLGGEQLEAAAVREFADLTRVAPSLIVRPAENPVNASVSIRGVGTFAFSIGVEPSVAVQVDDVPIAFQARAFADLADIERVEVLRGPQSTLYGKSASAGLINIVTPNPTGEWTGKLSALATTDDEYGAGAVISGPLTSQLGFRSANNWSGFEGNIRNRYNGEMVNGRETFSSRNKLVWDPTDRLNATASLDYIRGETTAGRPFIAVSPEARFRNMPAYPVAVFAPGVTVGPGNDEVVNNLTTGTDYEDFAQALRISYDLGPASLVSISSHDRYKAKDVFDHDDSALAFNNRSVGTFTSSQVTQELRLVSSGDTRFRYTLGLFYADVDFGRFFWRGPAFSLAQWDATAGSKQLAAFGQLEYDLTDTTTVLGGLRRGREEIRFTFRDIAGGGRSWSGEDEDTYTTYKLGVQHHLSDDVMLFAVWATGHKGQTYDLTTGFNQTRFLSGPVRPETSEDFEAGVRSQFFDRRLTLNLTAFQTRYENFQAQGSETLPDGTQNFRLTNVGAIRSRGAELEASARPVEGLSLSGSVAYLDAKITDFPNAQCYPGQTAALGCIGAPAHQDLTGATPPQSPKWKLAVSVEYTRPLAGEWDGFVQAAGSYQSKVNYFLNQDPLTVQDGYAVVNLTAGVSSETRGLRLAAFVNNLFDEAYYTNFANSYGNYGNRLALQAFLPRDFRRYAGVRASLNF